MLVEEIFLVDTAGSSVQVMCMGKFGPQDSILVRKVGFEEHSKSHFIWDTLLWDGKCCLLKMLQTMNKIQVGSSIPRRMDTG